MKQHKIAFLRRQFNWMGQHSGYDLLCDAIAQVQPDNTYHSVWQSPDQPLPKGTRRLAYRLFRKVKANPMYFVDSTAAEIKLLWHSWRKKTDLIHINYVENQLGLVPQWRKYFSGRIIGTAHQPAGWWRLFHQNPESLSALDALIVPASREVAYFEQYLPGRVHYVPHGVDTAFFQPQAEKTTVSAIRCVFSGKYLRDLDTLAAVIERVLTYNPHVQFDLILPRDSRNTPALFRIARYSQVHWHANLSDEQLRNVYQQASMLFLPLIDCTANNALLEGISCGLPVVSNDVGGLRDYTKNSFADLFPVGDVAGMTESILRLAQDSQEQENRSQAARTFIEQHLSWKKVAAQTWEIYLKYM